MNQVFPSQAGKAVKAVAAPCSVVPTTAFPRMQITKLEAEQGSLQGLPPGRPCATTGTDVRSPTAASPSANTSLCLPFGVDTTRLVQEENGRE